MIPANEKGTFMAAHQVGDRPGTTTTTAVQDVLVVTDVERTFGDLKAVDGVSLTIRAGETFGLLGPNGAGKTTTITMIAGLLAPDRGTIEVAGERIGPAAVGVKRHIGLVPQDLALYADLKGRENLRYFGTLQGLRGADLKRRVDEVLDVVGLADRAKDPVKEYSGGMKRRLNIAVGLLHRPSLLILDEPTVGVDPQSRNAILESVEALSGEGMAVLYTTHYMEEAERLCDRIAIIDSGRIQAAGTRSELIRLVGSSDQVRLAGAGDLNAAAAAVAQVRGVERADAGTADLLVTVTDAPSALAAIVTAASAHLELADVEITRPDLEQVFLHLTGKALRD
ncbi:ABC transporter ATP-binding protein [Ruania halotolerans]|uniref:ABC transporter ATP-binding protein n=1 Tax=Ruania halotolerans TaxID=2897773 RepID=UPI001E4BE416|nr:ABC transporter ATP-binding protein [Ruania halotolerans]UFU05539.1 ABC transporter ATP-binding protein [Ruania halotolerans]